MIKVVLITGASSGIGKAIGEFLTTKNFKVYGTSREPQKYENSLFSLIELDVRNESSIKSAINYIIEKESRIDVLINNAGVGITGPVEEIDIIEMRKHFETNFFGPMQTIQNVLPQMRSQKSGLIINITSIAGYMGLPFRGLYSASKGSLELLTEAIAMETKQFGINICNVAPGDFATNIASGRYHSPLIKGSSYEATYGKTLDVLNSHVKSGNNPNEMGKVIYEIINSKNPKIHYKVGSFLQKFSIVLKRILPDLVYQKMLMKHYKL